MYNKNPDIWCHTLAILLSNEISKSKFWFIDTRTIHSDITAISVHILHSNSQFLSYLKIHVLQHSVLHHSFLGWLLAKGIKNVQIKFQFPGQRTKNNTPGSFRFHKSQIILLILCNSNLGVAAVCAEMNLVYKGFIERIMA